MDTRGLFLGFGAVLLLAASAPAADPATGNADSVAQAGRPRFRTFEGRFGDSDRPRARPGDADNKGAGQKKPEMRHRDGQHRSAKPGEQASKKAEPAAKKQDGPQHRKPELARDGRPDWKARWKPSAASFHGRKSGPGAPGQFAGRHGGSKFGNKYAAASWGGYHRHKGHGHAGGHHGKSGRYAFASKHGGKHKHSGMNRYAHGRHRGHGQRGQGYAGQHRGQFGRYASNGRHGFQGRNVAWGRAGSRGHQGHFACRGHRGFQHGAFAARGGRGSWGHNAAVGRMAAVRWHHRGFGPGQFGRQGQGAQGRGAQGFAARGFGMNPWLVRSKWQGFGPGQMARGPQAGQRPQAGPGPQHFHRPWEAQVRPAGFPGRGPQARGGGQGDSKISELSARVERLQRELERLRREVR
ncbi:MAG: hypothetical protein K8T91_13975 [Planctomycetes bacterium]|nr:hypothetical protein [Planctomycetota bacterium]